MTRKEEIEKAAEDYYNEVKYLSDLSAFPIAAFKAGAEWADEHHNKKLWDKEKVCLWFKKNILKYMISGGIYGDNLLIDLTKAMEGISPYYVPKSGIPLP